MKLSGNTALVTGGATGIGGAIARGFLAAGSKVVICGRRQDALDAFVSKHTGAVAYRCDLSDAGEREKLIRTMQERHPEWNVLVNNAGIQRRISLPETEPFADVHLEIAINLEAPIHLSRLAARVFHKKTSCAIVQVTSGLAFSPLANVPVYCATKAALHSFTLSLRHQLKPGGIEVIEIIPPAVQTDLGGKGLHDFGAPLEEFAANVLGRLDRGETEIAYGFAEQASRAAPAELKAIFERMNQSPRP